MSTLTMFIAWLLSLVGLQDCENDPTLPDCPTAAETTLPTSPANATSQNPSSAASSRTGCDHGMARH